MSPAELRDPAAIKVSTRDGGYDVVVQRGGLASLPRLASERVPAERFAVISDDNVAGLHGRTVMEACIEAGIGARLTA